MTTTRRSLLSTPNLPGKTHLIRLASSLSRHQPRRSHLHFRTTQLATCAVLVASALAWITVETAHHRLETPREPSRAVPAGLPGVITRVGSHDDGPLVCGDYHITVTLNPDSRQALTVAGQLCATAGRFDTERAEFDLPDAGYDHRLFAWPASGRNWARAAQHRATLAIDPMGTGASDRPDGRLLTVAVHAWIAHQIVFYLHNGAFGATYHQVVDVGTGTGAQIATYEAARWHDVAALVALDAGHTRSLPAALSTVDTSDDHHGPIWTHDGYLIPAVTARCAAGYYLPGAARTICRQDATVDGRTPVPAGLALPLPADAAHPSRVTAAVLIVIDARDPDTCPAGPCARTTPAVRHAYATFTGAAHRDLWIQPDAGRLGLLHSSGSGLAALVNHWIANLLPPPIQPPTRPALGTPVGPGATTPARTIERCRRFDLSRDTIRRRNRRKSRLWETAVPASDRPHTTNVTVPCGRTRPTYTTGEAHV